MHTFRIKIKSLYDNRLHQLEYFKPELFLFYMLLRGHPRRWVKYSSILFQSKKIVLINTKIIKKQGHFSGISFFFLYRKRTEQWHYCIVSNRTMNCVTCYNPNIYIYIYIYIYSQTKTFSDNRYNFRIFFLQVKKNLLFYKQDIVNLWKWG